MDSKITCRKRIPPRYDHWAALFRKMNVGDSVMVANEYGRMSAYQFGKRHKKRFTTRKDVGGFRVWRVA